MLKIGEFSALSHLTVKALRFYEKEGVLIPASTDAWTGYRFYETSQLYDAAKIKNLRSLGFSLEEIKAVFSGADERQALADKAEELKSLKKSIEISLSAINTILEDKEVKYRVTEKIIPEMTVYYSETVLKQHSDIMEWIPSLGEECLKLNPGMKCARPPYEFCEYPDEEYKETDIRVRHSEAVESAGKENENIKFRVLPSVKVLSVFHKGPYERLGEAYAFIMKYAEQNGYEKANTAREVYIDGIWNRESPEDWLTEIQLPIK